MNEDLDLVGILRDCPKGTKLYSILFGEVELVEVSKEEEDYPIKIKISYGLKSKDAFTSKGAYFYEYPGSECVLFPSKEERDWDKFKIPIPDKALVWCWYNYDIHQRTLRFYDAIHESTFSSSSGLRNDKDYDNYEVFKGQEPYWAIEARKSLDE